LETVIIKAPVEKIEFTTDRTHGGEGGIETLARSIEAVGIIHPPAVKELPDKKGHYRIIAGRRRFAAVKSLGWKSLEVAVHPEEADDEAIALAENVNREDMHPLDEAEKFKREIDSGKTAEETAKYYARSVSGIRQRVRLCKLIDGVKTMFRDGKINLSGAALIAGLPEEDQRKFLKKYGEKPSVSNWDISNFVCQAQRCVIAWIADKQCEKCKNRTRNAEPGLFEDFDGLKDACFDQGCYAGKWKKLIENLIAKEDVSRTENNIILDRGIPNFLPKKTAAFALGEVEYTVLSPKKHTWEKTSMKAKKDTAWLVTAPYASTDVKVQRVAYTVYERPDYSCQSAPSDPVKDFLIDQVADIAVEGRQAAAERVKAKYRSPWSLVNAVKYSVLHAAVFRRLKMESRENMAAAYLEDKCSGRDDDGGGYKEFIDAFDRDIFAAVFGPAGITRISDIPAEPLSERLFLFLAAAGFRTADLPDLNDSDEKWRKTEKSLFWKFAQMSREEYIAMYRKILSEAVRAAIPGPAREEAAPEETGGEPYEEDE
jgi:ParB/RepB/Spo0J family partition protein